MNEMLICDVHFTSYFSCMDIIEALNGTTGDTASYLDYGYFGVLGADFDENGRSVGEYTPKQSYYALQNIASIFAEPFETYEFPCVFKAVLNYAFYEKEKHRNEVISGGFKRENGEVFTYWYPSNIMNSSYEATVSFEIYSNYNSVRLIDVMDGAIYEIPSSIVERDEFGVYHFTHLPIKDTPFILEFGNFIKE